MSINILDQLAKQQGIDNLPKVDPNTQDISKDEKPVTNLVLQAAIPSVLAGFYQYTRSEENAESLLNNGDSEDWINLLFGNDKKDLINKIAAYASAPATEVSGKLQQIARDTYNLVRSNASPATGAGVKTLLINERTAILQHLPGAIGIGKVLNDTTLDDRTNKMEGPVSSLMHAIEKQFTSTDVPDTKNF